jgi:hypothetical protein
MSEISPNENSIFSYNEKKFTFEIKQDEKPKNCFLNLELLLYIKKLKLGGELFFIGNYLSEYLVFSGTFLQNKVSAFQQSDKNNNHVDLKLNNLEHKVQLFGLNELSKNSREASLLVIESETILDVNLDDLIALIKSVNPLVLINNADLLKKETLDVFLDNGYAVSNRVNTNNNFIELIGNLNTHKKFFNVQDYWQERYEKGGNSGAGSYNRLAKFKAKILNDFIKKNHVETAIELGCGDGSQLGSVSYPNYIGFDISEKAVDLCRDKYARYNNKHFFAYSGETLNVNKFNADLTVSLDVIYHLSNDVVYDNYLINLFSLSKKYVVIYSNYNELYFEGVNEQAEYVRFRNLLIDIKSKFPDWGLIQAIPNQYPFNQTLSSNTSFADFFIFEKDN